MPSADDGDDQARFLADLRALRDTAALGYEELAARAHYPSDVLKEAENGPRLPSLPLLAAYVRACGGDVPEWEERWRRLGFEVHTEFGLPVRPTGASPAAIAGARAGTSIAPPEAYDPERVRAALRNGHQRAGEAAAGAQAAAGQVTATADGDGCPGHPGGEDETPFQRGGHDRPDAASSTAVADAPGPASPDQPGAAAAGLTRAGRDQGAPPDQPAPGPAPPGSETSPWFRAPHAALAGSGPRSWPASGTGAGIPERAWPAQAPGSSPDRAAAAPGPGQQAAWQRPGRGAAGLNRLRVLAIILLAAVICGVLIVVLP